jgi:hypothetical protein
MIELAQKGRGRMGLTGAWRAGKSGRGRVSHYDD